MLEFAGAQNSLYLIRDKKITEIRDFKPLVHIGMKKAEAIFDHIEEFTKHVKENKK